MRVYQSLIIILLLYAVGKAGIKIVSEQEQWTKGKKHVETITMYLEPARSRLELQGEQEKRIIIFNDATDIYWVIDDSAKTYFEVNIKQMVEHQKNMQQTVDFLQQKLKNLPPEYQKQMKKMMKDQNMPKPSSSKEAATIVYTKKGSGIKVQRWMCDHYEGKRQGKKYNDVWATDIDKLGLSWNDFKVFEDYGSFFTDQKKGKVSLFGSLSNRGDEQTGFPGFPIKVVRYDSPTQSYTVQVKEITKKKFETSLFELPAGLTLQQESSQTIDK